MGRHSKPTHAGRTVVRLATLLAATTGPLAVVPEVSASPPGVAEAIRECESGDRNVEHGGDAGGVSTASGYYQFVNGTWKTFGGQEFAPRAIGASKAEQTIVFERAVAANGLKDWEASRHCWQGKVGRHAKEATVRGVIEPVVERHSAPTRPVADPAPAAAYTVRPGDTLARIAAAHHTDWRKIYERNRDVVDDPHWIFPGERLRV
jgi:LysM repeat protein